MRAVERFVEAVAGHTKLAILVMVLLSVVVGAGAPKVEQSSSLEQFQSDTEEGAKLDYIEENFTSGDEEATTAQVVLRDENVLDKESLLASIEYQEALRANETVDATLAGEQATFGIANVVATAAIKGEQGAELQRTAAEFRRLNATVTEERVAIRAERATLENRSRTLNETSEALRSELTYLRANPDASVEASFERVRTNNTTVELNETDYRTFERAAEQLRAAENQNEAEAAYRLGTQGVLRDDYAALQRRASDLESRAEELQEKAERLRELGERLREQQAAMEESATLDEQREKLRSMNESEIDEVVTSVLSEDGEGGDGAFALMPTTYEPGSTTAEATMLVVTQRGEGSGMQETASEAITDSQLAMQDIARERGGETEYVVFGAGIIFEEINQSMTDSLLIVGPMALLFVMLALLIAYRDLLDIVLGLVGIGVVLLWTFGVMGWFDIAFNQIFIAVPVLLIGLSIDYAIHIFMRHREERAHGDSLGPRGSMTVALTGVGIALVWVTATTVIGFLSNLTSPVPPIREFGVVSSAGIVSALLVFGVLVPSLKVELDEFLEARGVDRRKRAFGTGGGATGRVLSVGATAARRAPALVIVAALLLSAGGAYGATQVDTSFDQTDFLAEDPPGWMDRLPEPFAPGEYTAARNLEYVNDRFLRQDSQAQILVEGDVTDPATLQRLAAAQEDAADKPVTQTLSNGEANLRSPLTAMQQVAAENESFNATLAAADTDGDGVPDRNVAAVYDRLFDVAPDQAADVVHRTESGDYRAVRLVVSVEGGASGDAVTTQMRDVAATAEGESTTATATGSAILNKIVQDQLLETVVQSLLITLVVTFLFLMFAYRLTEGSASLGAVTLLPVALSVAWILGTMYLMNIPFNVLTGMITSLTVGLGVAYSIHLSERYTQELDRTGDVWEAMHRAVTGTGGALLGSAATTVGGFGVLAFAILPPLQQFGVITGMTIVYAFLASVLVLPSLLVVWTKYVGPSGRDVDVDETSGHASAGE